MESKKTKTLILNTLILLFCVVIIGLFSINPKKNQVLDKFQVNFDTNGGTYIAALEIEKGQTATEPTTPTRDGYEFVGWMLGDELYDFSQGIEKDITLKAEWKQLNPALTYYTVSFYSAGGTTIANQIIEEGQLATMPETPIREGFTFVEWRYDGNPFDFNTPITQNYNLTAEWVAEENPDNPEEKTYSVRFNLNGGTGTVRTQNIKEGERATRPSNPTRPGFNFNDWHLNSAGGAIYNFTESVNSNITLYAGWDEIPKNQYTVRFYSDGSLVNTTTVVEGGRATAPQTPNKPYYDFLGWFDINNSSGGNNVNNVTINSDKNFYARWNKRTFRVTCDLVDSGGGAQSCYLKVSGVSDGAITKVQYYIKGTWKTKDINNGRYIFNYKVEFLNTDAFKITLNGEEFDATR